MKSTTTVADVLRSSVASATHAFLSAEPHIRSTGDPNRIHDARAAIRRLRSDLRVFKRFLDPGWAKDLRAELGWFAQALGAVRDSDVLMVRMDDLSVRLPDDDREAFDLVLRPLGVARAAAYGRLVATMEGERYGALRAQILEASHAPRFTPRAERTPGAAVYECVRQAWRKLERRVDDLGPNPKDEELHRVRISAKRCRYAVEAIQPFAKRRARRFLRRVARLQDILGELHDVSVERARLRNAMTNDSAAFVAGELAGLDVVARERARKAWGRAWKKVANKRLRFWKSHSAFPDGRPTTEL
jgi:CHAD domain-containing protein